MKRIVHLAIALLAALVPTAVNAKWREASSRNFVVYSEEDPEDLRKFSERLERFDAAIRTLRSIPANDPGPVNRLTVYVVSDVTAVQRLFGRGGGNVAGFYLPRAGGSIAVVPRRGLGGGRYGMNAETILLHEYTHHFMFANFPMALPAWLIEGFAEFHATTKFEEDGSVGIGMPALHRAHGLMSGNPLPVPTLMALGTEKLNDFQREAIYGRGWLLTHYLTLNPERNKQFATYLRELNDGKPSLAAAKAAFGDLQQLDRELNAYMRQKRMSYINLPARLLNAAPVSIRELSPAEQAVMEVKMRSKRGVDPAQAKALLPRVRRAAAPFPNDPAAQVTLAEAEFDAGNLAEAEAAADRALAANPKLVDAMIYKGRALMARAVEAKSTDENSWREVRRWFAAANRTDPDDPEPLILYYSSFAAAGLEPTPMAVSGLMAAYDLAPQDRGLRLVAARQLLVDGKGKEARAALEPVAYDPHAGPTGTIAVSIIGEIDKNGAAAALKIFDAAGGPDKLNTDDQAD